MRVLSAQEIVSVWEWGRDREASEQALGFLAVAYPGASLEELANLTIGRRDARLLAMRERTLGPLLQGSAECPNCAERLEYTLNSEDLRVGEGDPGNEHELESDAYQVRFRMPNSHDLFSASRCADTSEARLDLLRHCVVEARHKDKLVDPTALPESVTTQLAGQMEDLDPQAEILLGLACTGCDYRWTIVLDIASFFFTEISVLAKRLALEVHTLARAYGWSEADILAMSPARRSLYLEMAAG